MRRIALGEKETLETSIREAVSVLKQGGLIIYPTDTLYGIGADALNKEAIKKVYELKGRDFTKPLSVVVSDIAMAKKYVVISAFAERVMKKLLPGPFTLVLPRLETVPDILVSGRSTLGIRIPRFAWSVSLAKTLGHAVTATSANVSGEPNEKTPDAVLEQLKEHADLITLVIDGGEMSDNKGSTVIDLTKDTLRVVREGEVSKEEVNKILN